jgi:hypothetical protein
LLPKRKKNRVKMRSVKERLCATVFIIHEELHI